MNIDKIKRHANDLALHQKQSKLYVIEFVLCERPSPIKTGKQQYLVKGENYCFGEAWWTHTIDNKDDPHTPFGEYNALSQQEKYERCQYFKNWDNITKNERVQLGWNFKTIFNCQINNHYSPPRYHHEVETSTTNVLQIQSIKTTARKGSSNNITNVVKTNHIQINDVQTNDVQINDIQINDIETNDVEINDIQMNDTEMNDNINKNIITNNNIVSISNNENIKSLNNSSLKRKSNYLRKANTKRRKLNNTNHLHINQSLDTSQDSPLPINKKMCNKESLDYVILVLMTYKNIKKKKIQFR